MTEIHHMDWSYEQCFICNDPITDHKSGCANLIEISSTKDGIPQRYHVVRPLCDACHRWHLVLDLPPGQRYWRLRQVESIAKRRAINRLKGG